MIYLQDFQWQHWRHCSESCTPPPDVSWIYARVTTWRLLFGNCTDWLPVPQRIEFKLCLLVHNLQLGHSPKYLSDLLTLAADRKTLSLVIKLRLLHCTIRKFGYITFSVAAPRAWNRLPIELGQLRSTPLFKCKLKTFLFTAEFQNWTVNWNELCNAPSVGCRWRTRNAVCIVLY